MGDFVWLDSVEFDDSKNIYMHGGICRTVTVGERGVEAITANSLGVTVAFENDLPSHLIPWHNVFVCVYAKQE